MSNLALTPNASQTRFHSIGIPSWIKWIIARNPFYLASAGLLLYGINKLSTDPRLVGAELSMLRFNFCALIVYEILLATTAIALTRRRIWYDSLLLVVLANLFIIVPFSLISRAVYLNANLAFVMSASGLLLAVGKFWAFKRHIPNLNLSGQLLALGTLLLLANATAPLLFRQVANNPTQIRFWLNATWLLILPLLAGLANFLPRTSQSGNGLVQRSWIPFAFFFGWVIVTACHAGGIGYSLSFDWNLSLAVPTLWITAWTIFFRRTDLLTRVTRKMEASLLSFALVLPLMAASGNSVLPICAAINFACLIFRFIYIDRSRLALIHLLSGAFILMSGLPNSWLTQMIPGIPRLEWIVLCAFFCFFWLIFLSRDPRAVLMTTVISVITRLLFAQDFSLLIVQAGLCCILAHSFRWHDPLHKGAALVRIIAGVLWVLLSTTNQEGSLMDTRFAGYLEACALLVLYGLSFVFRHTWIPRMIPIFAAGVLLSEPGIGAAKYLRTISPGFLAVAASFVLFALGSLAAFSKAREHSSSD